MFPLNFPLSILQRRAKKGQWLVDPFCGRGTANFAARLTGVNTVGIDSNPVAAAIAEAKLVSCSPEDIVLAANEILEETPNAADVPAGEFWDWAYHPQVLDQICRLREGLLTNSHSKERKALRAIILGALHGHVMKTTASYFSNQCQRTYSPKPAYAVRFWQQHALNPPLVDIIAVIRKRAERYYFVDSTEVESIILCTDSRKQFSEERALRNLRADWFITSPPYYGMKSYLPDQWLRLWFVGGTPEVNYDKSTQLRHTGAEVFAEELRKVWLNLRDIAKDDARLVIRFGGLPSIKSNPRELLKLSLQESGWRLQTTRSAGYSSDGMRQAYQQAKKQNPPVEEFDAWATPE